MLRLVTGKPSWRRSAGFTMLEMMVVLAIIGLAFVVVLPNIGNLFQVTLSSLARDVQLELRQSRTAAVTRQAPSLFWVDVDAGEYGVGDRVLGEIPDHFSVHVSGADMARRGRRAGFLFFPDGSSTGGSVTLAQGDAQMIIEVDWLTGRVGAREQGL